MRAMYNSLSNAVCRTLDAVGSTAESAEKALGDVNHYVEENSKANRKTITYNAKTRAAKAHMAIQKQLDEDEKFSAAWEEIEKDW